MLEIPDVIRIAASSVDNPFSRWRRTPFALAMKWGIWDRLLIPVTVPVVVADGSRQEWVGRQCNIHVACRGSDRIWLDCLSLCIYKAQSPGRGEEYLRGLSAMATWDEFWVKFCHSVHNLRWIWLETAVFIEFDSQLETSDQAWLCLVRSICRGRSRCHWALIACSKHTKGLDLLDEAGDAGPSSPPDPNHHDPYAHKYVHQVYGCPAWQEERWLLHRCLQQQGPNNQPRKATCVSQQAISFY